MLLCVNYLTSNLNVYFFRNLGMYDKNRRLAEEVPVTDPLFVVPAGRSSMEKMTPSLTLSPSQCRQDFNLFGVPNSAELSKVDLSSCSLAFEFDKDFKFLPVIVCLPSPIMLFPHWGVRACLVVMRR